MSYKFETLQLHIGQENADPATDSRAVPIYQTTSYVFHNSQHAADRFGLKDAGNIYGRLTNSTQDVLEKRIAALEGGVASLAVSSGATSITYAIQALAKQGEHIVAQKTIYGGSYNLLAHTLPLYGITTTFVDVHNLSELEDAIQPNTKAVYIETLGNPNSDIITRVVTIFRELRSGSTLEGDQKLKSVGGVLSTAEAISMLTNSMALAGSFGNGNISEADLAAALQGAIVKDEAKDQSAWIEYLENVMKKRRGSWTSLYKACRELN